MKSNAIHASKAFFVVIVMVLACTIFAAGTASAQEKNPAAISEPSVSYLGNNGEQVAFKLRYDNPAGNRFILTILNGDGEMLFSQAFNDREFGKTIKAPSDIGTMTFIIRDDKARSAKKIRVDTNERFVEEVSVTRL